ncbi:MAG: hypothetical protein JSV79_02800 [Armatimonadota bacterium]|nr:MAG: hypothetical protein JSV79_02800 [Armatimonadota bacterium]
MEIKCPNCGAENWLENQSRCFQCNAVLRRCIDCTNYDRRAATCTTTNADIDLREAEHPSVLSCSTNCTNYSYLGQAA